MDKSRFPLALYLLTLSTFVIGTSEFVILGLLPDVARGVSVSIPAAGWLVSGYALGIAIGGPLLAVLTARFPRKVTLMLLMTVFLVGNLLCAIAPFYGVLMLARVVASLGQGAFFGVGAVFAAGLVEPKRQGAAIAVMFAGLTFANVIGVPIGTAIGHWGGWRSPFWLIAAVSALALVGLWRLLPRRHDEQKVDVGTEFRALGDARIWSALATTVLFATAIFTLFTYAAPMLGELTGVSPNGITWSLVLLGLGLTLGNVLGGRLADKGIIRALTIIALAIAVASVALRWLSPTLVTAEFGWFAWGVVTFAAVPTLQVNVMRFGGAAPNLVSTLNIAAFNAGIALGARVGGGLLSSGLGLADLPVAAGLIALLALGGVRVTDRLARRAELRLAAA
ncbi:MFS transporter [Luteibacter pinisoli]|uniref:MFS transporter n=1 Tax=Luteibacter pinisoli TaxID=2589080 RepID=A0A4Y5Z3J7_9GAMM|nr:MFS transporter [Luteibacter pinisoli]QDE39861.1 MFS transporter [Luteibacter pinisoli]